MFALGISQDLYGSGVALSDGDSLLFAANEERYSRLKNDGGVPRLALQQLLQSYSREMAQVSDICFCGILTPPPVLRLLPGMYSRMRREQDQRSASPFRRAANFAIHHTPVTSQLADSAYGQVVEKLLPAVMRRCLPESLRGARLHFAEHHSTHAYGAYCQSGFERALCITSDGMGDGVSLTVNDCNGNEVRRLAHSGINASLGMFFESLTEAFGFVPSRDEGKITGIAAHGRAAAVGVPRPFTIREGLPSYRGPHGLRAVEWVRRDLLGRHAREDVAAWAQAMLEDILVEVARHWLAKSGHERLVLSGGTMGNVKLNQRLHELPEVREVFVGPNMGDGGNAAGALAAKGFLKHKRLQHVFLGDTFSEEAIAQVVQQAGLPYQHMEDPAREIAARLAQGAIIARFDGAMEWGPRALGNRSVLAAATTPDVMAQLNEKLKRSDFMPFAPAILDEEAPRLLRDYEAGLFAGEFMTVCFNCSDEMKRLFPAVVHVDGTARAQIVRQEHNPGLFGILSAFKVLTGAGVLLNTSFNMHEEPIVCNPQEAVAAFLRARLDFLAMGPFLVPRPD